MANSVNDEVKLTLLHSVMVGGALIPAGTFISLPYDAFLQAFPEYRSKPKSFMESVVTKATDSIEQIKRGPGRPPKTY